MITAEDTIPQSDDRSELYRRLVCEQDIIAINRPKPVEFQVDAVVLSRRICRCGAFLPASAPERQKWCKEACRNRFKRSTSNRGSERGTIWRPAQD